MTSTENINIAGSQPLMSPAEIKAKYPVSEKLAQQIMAQRQEIQNIIEGKDPRPFVVIGPCSIHDVEAAYDYARRLKKLSDEVESKIKLVMRVYFEKPRTTTGWKGLINDPRLNDSFEIEEGLQLARQIMIEVASLGLPVANESLDPVIPQYLADLIAWTAIGARTTESQIHREMSSGLSMPVGFKNGTDGNITIAVNAIKSASAPHSFLGVSSEGKLQIFHTKGNKYGHVVLRGGITTNYDEKSINDAVKQLQKAGVCDKIMVDCSHGNSSKDHNRQPIVFRDVIQQIVKGNKNIVGFMVESHIGAGRQDLKGDPSTLQYGVSITDACIDWPTTEALIKESAALL